MRLPLSRRPNGGIRLHHSTGDEAGVIATLGLLNVGPRDTREICFLRGFNYLGTMPALPKGVRAGEHLLSLLFLAKSN